jgi:putative endonuclease
MDHLSKGKEGEEKAIAYLLNQGIEIIERNYRAGKFELDIIARQAPFLLIIEVKFRKNNAYGYPEHSVTETKFRNMQNAAVVYMEQQLYEGPVRYDVIAITNNQEPIWFKDVSF